MFPARIIKKTLFSLFIFSLYLPSYASEGLKIGSQAPNIIGRTLDGKLFRLNKLGPNLKVINFFWYRCVPCEKELPELKSLEKKHPEVKFFAVHTEDIARDKVVEFLNGLGGYPSNIILANKRVKPLFNFDGVPHTVVLDEKNRVKLVLGGYTEENMKNLRRVINE